MPNVQALCERRDAGRAERLIAALLNVFALIGRFFFHSNGNDLASIDHLLVAALWALRYRGCKRPTPFRFAHNFDVRAASTAPA
jgi:hypothetical protein